MTNTCQNCRHWGYMHDRCCDAIELGWLAANATKVAVLKAYADDDSGLTARMETTPDFSCAMFTPKAEGTST